MQCSWLFQRAQCIGLYAPLRQEVQTQQLWHTAVRQGKKVAYPCMQGEELMFHWAAEQRATQWQQGAFGVWEPVPQQAPVPVTDLDLLVVPGVAFDVTGSRCGYGKGYYDRLLANQLQRPLLIGLAYDGQIVPCLPRESHDVAMDWLATESGLYRGRLVNM